MQIKNPTIFPSTYSRYVIYLALALLIVSHPGIKQIFAENSNGFDLQDSLVPVDEIYHGGPARDGIPSIDKPIFLPRNAVEFLQAEDRVLGLNFHGVVKAYPLKILEWHEIVNDSFAHEPVVVTYCPLCGSGMAFSSRLAGVTQKFGVSGLLYNNDMLLYDRASFSLWSQILGKAISGPLKGHRLNAIPLEVTTWRDWSKRFSQTLVLSTQTGYSRNYSQSPYVGYASKKEIYYPLKNRDHRYHPKERVIGVELNGSYKAYPFIELSRKQDSDMISDEVGGRRITIQFDKANRTARVTLDGKVIPTVSSYWFAWVAFHPDTKVYKGNQ